MVCSLLPSFSLAATAGTSEPDWSSSIVKSPVECRQLRIDRSKRVKGVRKSPHGEDRAYWKEVNLLGLVRPSEVSDIAISAWLSKGIYQCKPSKSCTPQIINGSEWRPILDSQDQYATFEGIDNSSNQFGVVESSPFRDLAGTDIANTTAQALDLDPAGFRAVAFRNSDKDNIFIVFRGTDIASIKDWLTDFKQLVWKPAQYQAAEAFTKRVVQSECGSENASPDCLARFRGVGHSLGGGLAQHVARETGLDAYTYNAAGLGFWPETGHSPITRLRDDAKILHFFSQGYRLGNTYGMDIVPITGFQLSDANCEVPVELPIWAWDTLTVGILTHNMEGLASAISDINAGLAAAGITDEVIISILYPPELTNSSTVRLACTANKQEATTVRVAAWNRSSLDGAVVFELVGHKGASGYSPGRPEYFSFFDVIPGKYEVRIRGKEVLASKSIEILPPTGCR